MSKITISTSGRISVGSTDTGYGVKQTAQGTVVYVTDLGLVARARGAFDGVKGGRKAITLPHQRYSLAHDGPASGVPGRKQFEEDFLAALRSGGKTQAQICADRLRSDFWLTLAEVADEMGAIREYGRTRYDAETETRLVEPCARSQWIGGDPLRFVFPDGSAIVEAGCARDLEGAEPFSWANE